MNRQLIVSIILLTMPFGVKYFVRWYYGMKPGVRGVVLPTSRPNKFTTQPVSGTTRPTTRAYLVPGKGIVLTTNKVVSLDKLNLPSIKVPTTVPSE